jgi:hypothetical protein
MTRNLEEHHLWKTNFFANEMLSMQAYGDEYKNQEPGSDTLSIATTKMAEA